MTEQLLPGYWIRAGSSLDRALLMKFMQLTYQELFPEQDFSHLTRTVEQYFSKETPLWWVEFLGTGAGEEAEVGSRESEKTLLNASLQGRGNPRTQLASPGYSLLTPVACLWVGNAVDQVTGDRHAHIFLLYVKPAHRRQGIGKALMHYVETWALNRGDRQIGLQVFQSNTAALNLYNQLGYQTESLWMVKQLK